MNLRQLEYFVTVVECGSFSKAAQTLHIAQPALSQQVRKLANTFLFNIHDEIQNLAGSTKAREMVVTTALGTIRIDLGASMEALQWTVNAYTLTFAVLLLTGAALGDRLGRRRMFAAGLGLFVAASVACALATNVGWLIAARAARVAISVVPSCSCPACSTP